MSKKNKEVVDTKKHYVSANPGLPKETPEERAKKREADKPKKEGGK